MVFLIFAALLAWVGMFFAYAAGFGRMAQDAGENVPQRWIVGSLLGAALAHTASLALLVMA